MLKNGFNKKIKLKAVFHNKNKQKQGNTLANNKPHIKSKTNCELIKTIILLKHLLKQSIEVVARFLDKNEWLKMIEQTLKKVLQKIF